MKRFLLLAVFLLFCGSVFGAESISNLTTNSPVPLEQTLTITGRYLRTDVNQFVFCKFVTFDANSGKAIDRLTDEEIFSDGTFYAETKVTEPPYYRTSSYTVRAFCGGVSRDVNFSVAQRVGIENFFFGELFFLKDNGYFLLIALLATFVLVIVVAVVWRGFSNMFRG